MRPILLLSGPWGAVSLVPRWGFYLLLENGLLSVDVGCVCFELDV
jgi:hypothetical protein